MIASSIVVSKTAASILVVLSDGSRHAAKVVARDYHRDLVLLKIETTKKLTAVDFPEKLDLRIGKTTVAVGRFGNGASPIISRGVLSGVERLDGIALQTDARVSPAFYGGPLMDLYGNVLGILIPAVAGGAGSDPTGWYDSGIAFAIPSDVIQSKLDRLKSGTDIKRGLIGIASKTKDPYDDGTGISAVRKRSPAESAGIKAGDEVIEIAGRKVKRHQEIKQALGRFDAGESIRIKLRRDGKEIDVTTQLAETIPPLQPQRLGVLAREQTRENEQVGVIVDGVLPETPADGKIEAGDELLKFGDAKISSLNALRSLLMSAEPETAVEVTISRAGTEQQIKITPSTITGPLLKQVPPAWSNEQKTGEWYTEEIKLPDAGNSAAFLATKPENSLPDQGLLVLLLNPSEGSPIDVLAKWRDAAVETGVAICAVAPEDTRRWQPKEINAIGNFAAAVMKKTTVNPMAVAVAAPGAISGTGAEAADSMALAVAVSQSATFAGVSVSATTRSNACQREQSIFIAAGAPVSSEELAGVLPSTSGLPRGPWWGNRCPNLLNWVRSLRPFRHSSGLQRLPQRSQQSTANRCPFFAWSLALRARPPKSALQKSACRAVHFAQVHSGSGDRIPCERSGIETQWLVDVFFFFVTGGS